MPASAEADPKILEGTVGAAFPPGAIAVHWPLPLCVRRQNPRHEASGTVVEIGKEVKGNFQNRPACRHEFPQDLRRLLLLPEQNGTFLRTRYAFRRRPWPITAASKRAWSIKLPEDLPLDVGAFLEPLSIAVHAVDIAKIKNG